MNPHAIRHTPLKRACLPVPALSHELANYNEQIKVCQPIFDLICIIIAGVLEYREEFSFHCYKYTIEAGDGMHVFLTGEVQIGKSTAINRALDVLNMNTGGFRTMFLNRSDTNRTLHILDAGRANDVANSENVIAEFGRNAPCVFTKRFETLGVEYIRRASSTNQLIIMDECGTLEADAAEFRQTILESLDNAKPILGVIKEKESVWLEQIKQHPNVHLITVTLENRNGVPAEIIKVLSSCNT